MQGEGFTMPAKIINTFAAAIVAAPLVTGAALAGEDYDFQTWVREELQDRAGAMCRDTTDAKCMDKMRDTALRTLMVDGCGPSREALAEMVQLKTTEGLALLFRNGIECLDDNIARVRDDALKSAIGRIRVEYQEQLRHALAGQRAPIRRHIATLDWQG